MKTTRPLIALSALSALLSGCGGGGVNGLPKITSVNPLSTGKLGFAVGTANLYGTEIGLNVVATYRQAGGTSNVLVDTPTITGPFTLPPAVADGGTGVDPYSTLPGGPSVEEVAQGGIITGTSQNVHLGTPACDSTTACPETTATTGSATTVAPNTSTFGQSGGVFTDGISPGNSTTSGTAASYTPYQEPLYDTTSGNAFTPYGGPPAFEGDSNDLGLRDGLFNLGSGVVGIPLGFATFAGVTPSTGSYTLSLSVPTGNSGGVESYGKVSATGTIATTATLGAITAPTLVLDGNGGGTFAITSLPAGVTEELVEIVDTGDDDSAGASNCQGPIGANALPVYYTILVKSAGTYTLPDTIGPNSTVTSGKNTITPSESICTAAANATASTTSGGADNYTVQAIGVDYPLYESLYPNTTSQSPTLTGANGQADITISALSSPTVSSDARARKKPAAVRSRR